jgi:DNA-binding CsgD family transcriptional regulator
MHYSEGDPDDLRALVEKRDSPRFFITDRRGNVQFCSPNLAGGELAQANERALGRLQAGGGTLPEIMFEALGPDVLLRIVPLAGETAEHFAVFIEAVSSRNSLGVASKRFGLTKRERDVLEFIVKGYSTAQIARSLFISEGTVGDHIKNLFRKTKTNRRSELLARVLQFASEPSSRDVVDLPD